MEHRGHPRPDAGSAQYHFNWKTLSAMAGVTWWNFYFRLFPGDGGGQQCYITMKLMVWHSSNPRTEDFDDAYMYIDPGPITVGSSTNQANGNLAFSNIASSKTQTLTFTLTNNDSTPHSISSKAFSRGYPSQKFSAGSTDTCGTSIPANTTCTLSAKVQSCWGNRQL